MTIGLGSLSTTGCAHYYFPANQLEIPEASGSLGKGRIELLGFESGSDLVAAPVRIRSGVYDRQHTFMNPVFGAMFGINSRLELGVRYEVQAPLLLRAKYQFLGVPESQSTPGSWSLAGIFTPGFMLGTAGGQQQTYLYLSGGLLAGFRAWKNHLFSIGSYYSLANLSGTSSTTGSGSQISAIVGYQYDLEDFFIRGEESYTVGKYAGAEIKALFGAAQLGFRF